MKTLKQIEVFMDEEKVGTLAAMKNNLVAFQYDFKWLKEIFGRGNEYFDIQFYE